MTNNYGKRAALWTGLAFTGAGLLGVVGVISIFGILATTSDRVSSAGDQGVTFEMDGWPAGLLVISLLLIFGGFIGLIPATLIAYFVGRALGRSRPTLIALPGQPPQAATTPAPVVPPAIPAKLAERRAEALTAGNAHGNTRASEKRWIFILGALAVPFLLVFGGMLASTSAIGVSMVLVGFPLTFAAMFGFMFWLLYKANRGRKQLQMYAGYYRKHSPKAADETRALAESRGMTEDAANAKAYALQYDVTVPVSPAPKSVWAWGMWRKHADALLGRELLVAGAAREHFDCTPLPYAIPDRDAPAPALGTLAGHNVIATN